MTPDPSSPAVTPPLRVLVIAHTADRSELAAYAWLRRALGDGFQLAVSPRAIRLPAIRAVFPDVILLDVRSRCDLAAAVRLRRLCRALAPDVVFAPHNRTLAAALLATRGLPARVIGYRGTLGHISRLDPASWITYLHPRLAHIDCVSDAVLRHLRDDLRLEPARLSRIYKGHDMAWYDGTAASPADLGEFGVPAGATLVGFAGTVRAVKGVEYLIAALAHLPPHVHLLIIGDVRDRRVERLVRHPPRPWHVHVTGWRADAVALMRRCDVMVTPSVSREGLPRAVIEALAVRKPVVVTDVGGIPEIVEDGVGGLVVPPRDPVALAGAIRRLLDDPAWAACLAEAGRRRVETTFSVPRMAESLLELFRRCCAA